MKNVPDQIYLQVIGKKSEQNTISVVALSKGIQLLRLWVHAKKNQLVCLFVFFFKRNQ